jgi:hypothetical protein
VPGPIIPPDLKLAIGTGQKVTEVRGSVTSRVLIRHRGIMSGVSA